MARFTNIRPLTLLTIAVGVMVLVGLIAFQQRTRVIEGTWIDLFEGSSFFENEDIASACSPDFFNAPHFAYHPERDTPEYKFIEANRKESRRKSLESGEQNFVSSYGAWSVSAYSVKFVGRQKFFDVLGYGHLGVPPSRYVVEKVISIEHIPVTKCDVRPA